MVQAVHEAPDADNASVLEAPRGRRSVADEAKIERALVELGFVPPHAVDDPGPDAAGEPDVGRSG